VKYAALLRGINLAGHKMVAMAELRAALTKLGFSDVSTLLQSGNVVFSAQRTTPAKLEALIEKDIEKRFKMQVDIHVRDGAELASVIDANPLRKEAEAAPSAFLVTFYREPLDAALVKTLQSAISGPEKVRCVGRHLYMTFPEGIGNSKAALLIDKTLRMKGTARNWNTVTKIAALMGD
jgi:uncharacterized protein (DUF1697 family)